jgi:hypothetical protein
MRRMICGGVRQLNAWSLRSFANPLGSADRGQTNLLEFLRSRFGITSDFASAVALAVAFSPSHGESKDLYP